MLFLQPTAITNKRKSLLSKTQHPQASSWRLRPRSRTYIIIITRVAVWTTRANFCKSPKTTSRCNSWVLSVNGLPQTYSMFIKILRNSNSQSPWNNWSSLCTPQLPSISRTRKKRLRFTPRSSWRIMLTFINNNSRTTCGRTLQKILPSRKAPHIFPKRIFVIR